MAGQQPAKTQVIYVEDLGFIPIVSGQSVTDAIAAAQAKQSAPMPSVGGTPSTPPSATPAQVAQSEQALAQMPQANTRPQVPAQYSTWDNIKALIPGKEELIDAIPQLAGLAASAYPATAPAATLVRGMPGATIVPALANVVKNLLQGQSPSVSGVLGDAALGGFMQWPTSIGERMTNTTAPNKMRQALFSQTDLDSVSDHSREAIPKLALNTRAAATKEGVQRQVQRLVPAFDKFEDLTDQTHSYTSAVPKSQQGNPKYAPPKALTDARDAAGQQYQDEVELANLLKGLEKYSDVRGPKGGATAAPMSGSGSVTTAVRATGIPAAAGQAVAPVVGAMKGTPARRIAVARNMHRPGNIATTETLGHGTSQLARLAELLYETTSENADSKPKRRRNLK